MKTLALVPVKMLQDAKSRMQPRLTSAERVKLVRALLASTLGVLGASGVVQLVGVVSPDTEALALAVCGGATPLRQDPSNQSLLPPHEGLNAGLEQGRAWALASGAEALLVVLPDLPLLAASDIRGIVQCASTGSSPEMMVLAPDRARQGTNIMLLRPPHLLSFSFGAHSYRRHKEMAQAGGVEPVIFSTPGTELDLDTPDDLDTLAVWTAGYTDPCFLSLSTFLQGPVGSPNAPDGLPLLTL